MYKMTLINRSYDLIFLIKLLVVLFPVGVVSSSDLIVCNVSSKCNPYNNLLKVVCRELFTGDVW